MLYLDAVCKGIDDIPDVDHDLREQLIAVYKEKGIEHLRLQLKTLDPEYYAIVDLKNPKRLLHALEICLMTGRTYTSFRTNTKKERLTKSSRLGSIRTVRNFTPALTNGSIK
jgi:tRNA dimethylallyltransferase